MSTSPEADSPASASVSAQQAVFDTTHWSAVMAAGRHDTPDARDALAQLCQTYWYPLYAYVRRQGHSLHDAQDLTQAFFTRLIEKDWIADARQEKGRFRSFLLTALKRFMANEWDRQHAQKRGGFQQVLSIDQELAESRFGSEPIDDLQPDVLFDRQWASTLLDRVMARLHEEYLASGRAKLFEHLCCCLTRDESALPYAVIASQLRSTETAVRMAAQRLRYRYRELLRAEIAETVSDPEEIEEELRHLFASFSR